MKIGILFSVEKEMGGVYQYGLAFLDALKTIDGHTFVIFNESKSFPKKYLNEFEVINSSKTDSTAKLFKKTTALIRKFLTITHAHYLQDLFVYFDKKKTITSISRNKIDLLISFNLAPLVFHLDIPSINPIHDLQHRINPQFPEVSNHGIWKERERSYNKLCKISKKILVDSEIGKEDVMNFYNVDENKIIILPFLPPNYLNEHLSKTELELSKKQNNLPEKFLFYPAQFWPHKNHIAILNAIKLLKDKGTIVNAVFTGSDKKQWGELKKLKKYIKDNKLEPQVKFLGYVSNDTISSLYKTAVALIMPTFFGPTNIPILEAWKMSCPVLYSDIRGCKEQLGNAGLLINPKDPTDIAEKIELIWDDETLRKDLIEKGKRRLEDWTHSDFSNKVSSVFKEI